MASVINMPRMSDTMEEGQLISWLKEEGDEVAPGEGIAEVETDKATLELESFEDGILAKKLVEAGTSVAIGAPVAILAEDEDDDISVLLAQVMSGGSAAKPAAAVTEKPAASAGPSVAATSTPATAQAPAPVAAAPQQAGGRIKASPLARKMASELGLDIGQIGGTGPGGRIIARDIESASKTAASIAPVASVAAAPQIPESMRAAADIQPLNAMRKTIARRMVAAKQAVPHFYLTMDIDMGPAADFRAQINKAANGSVKVSFNDLIVKASGLALMEHPWVNASYGGDNVLFHQGAHVGVAVAIEGGLITPVIRDAHIKSLGQIARETRELAGRAQAKKLKPDEYTGGTFSVSNLGMYGIREFVAIIDPPQAAILAVGSIADKPVVVDGALAIGKRMAVTLSCDHRVVDGATGAEFLGTLRRLLENPMLLVL